MDVKHHSRISEEYDVDSEVIVIPYLSPEFVAALLESTCEQLKDEVSAREAVSESKDIRQIPLPSVSLLHPSTKLFLMPSMIRDQFNRKLHERSMRCLRLDLIKMLRITLNTVDYTTKAYSLGSSDFAHYASSQREALYLIGGDIVIASRRLLEKNSAQQFRVASLEYARTITSALFSICHYAYEISSETLTMLQTNSYCRNELVVQTGDNILGFLRLFIVALTSRSYDRLINLRHRINEYRSSARKPLQIGTTFPRSSEKDLGAETIANNLESMVQDLFTAAGASLEFLQSEA
jgi:hypothetical protein